MRWVHEAVLVGHGHRPADQTGAAAGCDHGHALGCELADDRADYLATAVR